MCQQQADAAARAICKVIYDNCEMLGKMAAEETRNSVIFAPIPVR